MGRSLAVRKQLEGTGLRIVRIQRSPLFHGRTRIMGPFLRTKWNTVFFILSNVQELGYLVFLTTCTTEFLGVIQEVLQLKILVDSMVAVTCQDLMVLEERRSSGTSKAGKGQRYRRF